MRRLTHLGTALGLLAVAAVAYAGPPVEGAMEKQATKARGSSSASINVLVC